ncbi:acyltransferase [Mycobacterium sp. DL592]|uniref:acyltransferase family protein n=1 Tax=Mycobacterium sp. DL592 TaxID=2675524 RepID=UPI001420D3A3|nr:acyltransferase [Mycobacterium sp. DL592]
MTGTRNHAADLYRVLALVMVVIGHWIAAALTFRDGAFYRENPLVELPWTQWLTWLFQVVPVFFVVAGYASAVSWSRLGDDGQSRQAWIRHRLTRPLGPTAVYVVIVLLIVAALAAAGVAGTELDFGAWAVAMHLWFLGIYVLVIALTPVAVAAHRRWGLWVPLGLVMAVAVVDAASIGAHVPYVAWLNYLLPWAALYQLGIAWQDGLVGRRGALVGAAVSAVALVLLVTVGPYPISMIGVPGQALNNTSPPNLALLALGLTQSGLALAAAPAVNRALNSAWAQRILAVANDNVMALYLWHMIPVVVVALVGYPTGLLPRPELGTAAWWWFRLGWVAILAVVALVELVLLWRGRAFFAAPLPSVTVPIPAPLGAALMAAGTLAIAAALTKISIGGFAPDGRVPVGTAAWFAAGLVLVALTPSVSDTPRRRA